MMTFKERVKPSDQTRAKLLKPLTRQTAAAIKLTVKNVINSLDDLAWKLENQVDVDTLNEVKKIDAIIKDAKSLEKDLKKSLKV